MSDKPKLGAGQTIGRLALIGAIVAARGGAPSPTMRASSRRA